MRQLLGESLILATIGGGVGLLLAFGCRQLFLGLAPDTLGIQQGSSFTGAVWASALVTSLGSALAMGLFPALRLSRGGLSQILVETGQSTSIGKSRHRLLDGLVAGASYSHGERESVFCLG